MNRGFVLINALIIVAALSATAVFLLSRAETGRALLLSSQTASQRTAYLDAFQAYAILLINRDTVTGSAADHAAEVWARTDLIVPVDRGHVAGALRDMQAGFNINWLANPEDVKARAAFDRLLAQLGLSLRIGDTIVAHLRPFGPDDDRAYALATYPTKPVGGALFISDQLAEIPGISAEDRARLAEFITVLPSDALLNVNTAPGQVLSALLPELTSAQLNSLLAERRRVPFGSRDAFLAALGRLSPSAVPKEADLPRFSIGSKWFEGTMTAELGGHLARRRIAIERRPLPEGARVAWSISR